ncbi:Acetyltransferase (GNAT) family protein [Actinopolymorpha cephalotaxi]|uniref:Acetyltransferase (GNAT) family protein n=1 Tax=Actinopolymorpha cephalotaxi TaxID=504797 RepID=A0A1I2XC98_9ACTN|nr:GNAT family N-acetyltransferase [Actinopolymorpha cephalotaxi]NYH86177.1 GNAT superfamily N-acetyltransferase [Actinopolymorpha cephalotaxi]SFH11118.1 Acetyltransferase (GNAT) family protein [Actinopolymorpha cephalotaxi]
MDLEFSGEIWEWRGPAPYHFVTVPKEESLSLRGSPEGASYGWGMLPVRARIASTEWSTSLWPKDGGYVVPLKDAVRKPLELGPGDTVTIRLSTVDRPAGRRQRKAAAPRKPTPPTARPTNRRGPQVTDDQLSIVPANEASWQDLEAIFGSSGDSSRCWCQRFKMLPRETWANLGPERLAARLREQTAGDHPDAPATSGLVAYLDGEPVGWCAVDPRSANPRLLRNVPVPWVGRNENKDDNTVWAVTCLLTRAGFRRRGVSRSLARSAVDFARRRGARALEAYPHLSEPSHLGTAATFAAAGLVEVSRPTKNRAVMRVDF